MTYSWDMTIRARVTSYLPNDEPDAEEILREDIQIEGGIRSTIIACCKEKDLKIVSLVPVKGAPKEPSDE